MIIRGESKRRDQAGGSLIELSFVFPVFAALMMLAIDASMALGSYLTVNRTAYEAARMAAQTPGLEFGVFDDSNTYQGTVHYQLHNKINSLFYLSKDQGGGVTVKTGLLENLETTEGPLQNAVFVELKTVYNPINKMFGPISIGAVVHGSYLYSFSGGSGS